MKTFSMRKINEMSSSNSNWLEKLLNANKTPTPSSTTSERRRQLDNSVNKDFDAWLRSINFGIPHNAAKSPPTSNSGSWSSPQGVSWNAYLNTNINNGSIRRKMPLVSTNGRNWDTNSVVTPLDMYLALLYPSCPVGIDAPTRKKLRDYATRMNTRQPLLKTQRERMEAVLKRLVAAGDKCGLPAKAPGKRYRLPTKKEMEDMGFQAMGKSGKFFHKRQRNPDPPKMSSKSHKKKTNVTHPLRNYLGSKKSPSKRMMLAAIKAARYNGYAGAESKTNTEIVGIYMRAMARRDLKRLLKMRYGYNVDLSQVNDSTVPLYHQMAMTGNISFLQPPVPAS